MKAITMHAQDVRKGDVDQSTGHIVKSVWTNGITVRLEMFTGCLGVYVAFYDYDEEIIVIRDW